jgi:hypothetical protein
MRPPLSESPLPQHVAPPASTGIGHTLIGGDKGVAVNLAESLRWHAIEAIVIMFVVYFLVGRWARQRRKR